MKRLLALTLSLCLLLSLAACNDTGSSSAESGNAAQSAEASVDLPDQSAADRSAEPVQPQVATGAPNVALEQVQDNVLAQDGTVLVNYEYQKPTVTLPDAEAMVKVQEDLDRELQIFLDFVHSELADYARDAVSYSQEMGDEGSDSMVFTFQPYYAQYVVQVSRVDETVVSLVIDSVSYSGGAHGSDNRYCLNYDARTGERLTFDMLGKNFRKKAEELVLAKLEEHKAELDEGYEKQLPLVVCDGTESADAVNRQIYPDLYEDTSMEAEEGNLSAQYYFNDKGILFISGEYVMKSYAVGIQEYGASYQAFGDALKEEYIPADVLEAIRAKEEAKKKAEAEKAKKEAEKKAKKEAEKAKKAEKAGKKAAEKAGDEAEKAE